MVLCDPEFEGLLPKLSHSSAVEAVVKTMDVLHNAPAPQVQWNVGVSGAMLDSAVSSCSVLMSTSTSHKINYHKLNFPQYQPNYIFLMHIKWSGGHEVHFDVQLQIVRKLGYTLLTGCFVPCFKLCLYTCLLLGSSTSDSNNRAVRWNLIYQCPFKR